MFSQFQAGRRLVQVPKEPRAKGKLSLVLEAIKAKHPELQEDAFKSDREFLEELLKDGENPKGFYQIYEGIVKAHYGDLYEKRYRVIEEILNYVKESDPENYMGELNYAISQVLNYCITYSFNRLLPFVETLLRQAINIDSTNHAEYSRYLSLVMKLDQNFYDQFGPFVIFADGSTVKGQLPSSRKRAEAVGGDHELYKVCNQWPLHVQVENAHLAFDKIYRRT